MTTNNVCYFEEQNLPSKHRLSQLVPLLMIAISFSAWGFPNQERCLGRFIGEHATGPAAETIIHASLASPV